LKQKNDIYKLTTGDYFGPVVVCACITTQKNMDEFGSLNITDSKKMTDTAILEIAPKLMTALVYSLLVVDNDKYNEVHLKHNMNAIKAILHNQAYVHLKKKAGQLPALCVVDQFSPAPNYFRYLEGEAEIERNLHFETKAESKYFAVACASVIARYTFLKSFHAMEEHYSFSFPKGAGTHVDDAAVVPLAILGGQHKQTVADGKERGFVQFACGGILILGQHHGARNRLCHGIDFGKLLLLERGAEAHGLLQHDHIL